MRVKRDDFLYRAFLRAEQQRAWFFDTDMPIEETLLKEKNFCKIVRHIFFTPLLILVSNAVAVGVVLIPLTVGFSKMIEHGTFENMIVATACLGASPIVYFAVIGIRQYLGTEDVYEAKNFEPIKQRRSFEIGRTISAWAQSVKSKTCPIVEFES